MFGTEFEKEGFHYYCYYCVLLYQEKSPFLSLGTFNSSFSTVEQDPSNHPPKRIECAIKKVTFVTIKKELSCIIIELLANIFGKKILKILKMTFMVELPAQKTGRRVRKLILIFWHSRWHWVLKRSFFSVYPHLPFLLNNSLKVKKWYESSL